MSSSPIIQRPEKKKMMDKDLIGKQRTTTISDLPEEVLTHVLIRLSVKDIVPCLSVQKSWCFLIKTRMFMTLHSNYHQNTINPKKYLLFWNFNTDAYEIRLDDIQCEEYLTLKYDPPELHNLLPLQLVSNGLICVFDHSINIQYLWNPVIQKYKTLPDSPRPPYSFEWTRWKAIAFGFVPQISDYLVVYIVKCGLIYNHGTHYIMTCVYSLNTNSWRKITHASIPIVDISQYAGVFVNGVAIWVGKRALGDRVLICFDTKSEVLREILLPAEWIDHQSHFQFPVIHAFDQSIVYFVEFDDEDEEQTRQLGMWILKGDPMNEFLWEKKMMVTLHEDVEVGVMGVRNNGEPILLKLYDLISYNLDSHKSYDFAKSCNSWTPLFSDKDLKYIYRLPLMIKPFAESLGLLDIDCTEY